MEPSGESRTSTHRSLSLRMPGVRGRQSAIHRSPSLPSAHQACVEALRSANQRHGLSDASAPTITRPLIAMAIMEPKPSFSAGAGLRSVLTRLPLRRVIHEGNAGIGDGAVAAVLSRCADDEQSAVRVDARPKPVPVSDGATNDLTSSNVDLSKRCTIPCVGATPRARRSGDRPVQTSKPNRNDRHPSGPDSRSCARANRLRRRTHGRLDLVHVPIRRDGESRVSDDQAAIVDGKRLAE